MARKLVKAKINAAKDEYRLFGQKIKSTASLTAIIYAPCPGKDASADTAVPRDDR